MYQPPRASDELMADMRTPTRDGVIAAARSISQILPPTPLLPVEIGGVRCWIKAESLQPIGAFKIRGGWWRLSTLSDEERARGVVAVSSGNHAQGVAWAARKLGIKAAIVMPRDAPKVKLEATRALGAEIVLYDRPGEDRDEIAAREVEKRRAVLVHAFADPWVIEGQGSAGVEIAQQLGKQPPLILACCGGGGLTAGLALACPDSRIVPVEPEGWDDMRRSLEAGWIEPVGDNPPPTACDALQTPLVSERTFEVLARRDAKGVAVSEAEVRAAQRWAAAKLRLVVEPGGAVALAALLARKVTPEPGMLVVLSGGNVDIADYAAAISAE